MLIVYLSIKIALSDIYNDYTKFKNLFSIFFFFFHINQVICFSQV